MPESVESAFGATSLEVLASGGIAVVDGWLGHEAPVALRDSLIALSAVGCFARSRIGAGAQRQESAGIRGDSTCWFDDEADAGGCDGRRTISFSHYLSERRDGDQGGCLRLHRDQAEPVDIEPSFDRLVVFRSRTVLHEVLPVPSRRFSMTGWMSTA